MYDWLIVGAGFAGSVLAERLATERNERVLLIDRRNHIGGNAYDRYDDDGLLIHQYGPHIFHTNSKQIFDHLSKFTEWRFYEQDRKSTRLNSSHANISYAVFCLKKKNNSSKDYVPKSILS